MLNRFPHLLQGGSQEGPSLHQRMIDGLIACPATTRTHPSRPFSHHTRDFIARIELTQGICQTALQGMSIAPSRFMPPKLGRNRH
jgi:hypothetical protein